LVVESNLVPDSDYWKKESKRLHEINTTVESNGLPTYEAFVQDKPISVLIDSGATANYVSKRWAKGFKKSKLKEPLPVKTAAAGVTWVKTMVDIPITFRGSTGLEEQYVVQALIFPSRFDLILGLEWLKGANPEADWTNRTWTIKTTNGAITLNPEKASVDPELNFVCSPKQAVRAVKHREEVGWLLVTDGSVPEEESNPLHVKIVKDYADLFKDELPELPPARDIEHVIDTGDAKPINRPPFKTSPKELKELQEQLAKLKEKGLIEPSHSPWGAPVLFVRKKDGSMRLCVDYRAINKITVKNRYPLPRIDECLEQLGSAKYFSTLDLKSGYHQVRLRDQDKEKTAFNTRYGQFQFKVLPFGLTNAPPTFQSLMNRVLEEFKDKFALVYLDDILIFSPTLDQHEQHVRMVLDKLREHHLYLNPEKCRFGVQELSFVGYKVTANGILPEDAKVKKVQEWPTPTNVQEVRQFLGLASYYRRFIANFANIAAPMSDLTQGTGSKCRKIEWTTKCEEAFQALKQSLTNAPILRAPDSSRPYIIYTDASDFACGAVLCQQDEKDQEYVVAFESRKFTKTEQAYPAQERELLAILHALRTWRCFIEGTNYTVYTDHLPLKYLRSQKAPTPRLTRWMNELELYDPNIQYRPGKDQVVPDALSRIPWRTKEPVDADVLVVPEYLYALDNQLPPVAHESDWPLYLLYDDQVVPDDVKDRLTADKDNFKVTEDEVILRRRGDDVWVPFVPFVERADLIAGYHQQAGHASVRTMMHLVESRWWWPSMEKEIRSWLETCQECQLAGRPNKSVSKAPLHPLESAEPFARWHLDFVGELPVTRRRNRWILVAVDSTTNWPIARAYPDAKATTVANFLYEEIVLRFGCPQEIVTDRGSQFMSDVVARYTKRIRVNHKFTSAFHPRTNGKVERVNGMIKSMLRKYLHGAIHEWDLYLDSAVWALRIRKHSITGYSPFFLVYGREPVLPGDALRPYVSKEEANDQMSVYARSAKELEELGQARAAAEFRAKSYADKVKAKWDAVIKPIGFEIGDLVLLRLEQRYGLEYHWEGPYRIIKKNSQTDVYQLETFGGVTKKDWVHVDRLKKVKTVDKILETKPWFDVAVSRARWPAGALRDHSIVGYSSLPELVLPKEVAEPLVSQETPAAIIPGPPLQGAVEEANEASSMEEPDMTQEVLPDEDDVINEVTADTESVGSDGLPFVDVNKVFDVDVEPYEESKEETKKQEIDETENQRKSLDISNSAPTLEFESQDKPAYEDSDPDLDLDVRGRTSSLGGGVVRLWPTNELGVPMVVPRLGKRTVNRFTAPRKRPFPSLSGNLHNK
jgi:transposase InsO family protein